MMINKDFFHFDIETTGQYKDYDSLVLGDERGALLFKSKYDKMNWSEKYSDINGAYVDNAGIISTYGRIVCISFGFVDSEGVKKITSFSGDDEQDIVNSFNNLLNKIKIKNFTLCGFRILYFDIPWILHKLHKYGIVPSEMISMYDKKPWDMRLRDMSDDWKGRFAWSFSFDEMCYELGVKSPKENLNGSLVHKTYWSGDIDSVRKYCESDVSSSIDASLKIY